MEGNDYQWAEYQGMQWRFKMNNHYSHTKTIDRIEKEDPEKIVRVLRKIMDEAALGTEQGGGINYQYMLQILQMEDRKI